MSWELLHVIFENAPQNKKRRHTQIRRNILVSSELALL